VSEPVLRPPSGPKEILERYDIGESQLAGFFSGQPLGPSEEEVLAKILFRQCRAVAEEGRIVGPISRRAG
jgi:hypothetical protein